VASALIFDRKAFHFICESLCVLVCMSFSSIPNPSLILGGECLITANEVSVHTASRVAIWLAVCRVSRVRVRVSYPGQPCEFTSNGYTHGYGQS